MKAHGAKLPRKRHQAIAALIDQPTIKGAAQVAGIGEATLIRWMKDDTFKAAYRDAKRRIVDLAITRLQRASDEAVETLVAIMSDSDSPPTTRVACAKTILDMAVKAIQMDDVVSRIETLESTLNSGGVSK